MRYLSENRSKTETIKERAIYVYLPSHEMVDRWKNLSREHGTSISKFVIECVDNSLRQGEDTDFKPRGELIKEIGDLRSEIKELKTDLRQKRIVIDRFEDELRRYRSRDFMDTSFDGIRTYSPELIQILKKRGVVDSEILLNELDIDPKNGELVKAVSNQLENLLQYGLIARTRRGWRWIG